MLLRGTLAVALLAAGVVFSVGFGNQTRQISDQAPDSADPPGGERRAMALTVALTPLTLGNPAAAALLIQPSAKAEKTAVEPPPLFRQVLRTARGDTLAAMLAKTGIDRRQVHDAVTALGKLYNPRKLKIGQEVTLTFRPGPEGAGPGTFLGFSVLPDIDRRLLVERNEQGGFTAREEERRLTTATAKAGGIIHNSLFVAAKKAGVPMPVLTELIRAFSWDVDFQRDIQPGDSFQVMFERLYDDSGRIVQSGDLVFATMTLSGQRQAIYRHGLKDGGADYFDEKGRSVKRALLRTPIDGARLSSRFGKRRHPILGYTKMHRGVDFAAPKGTPVYAAGRGSVVESGRNGAYGKYVRLRHNGEYSTAYAHMTRIAKSARKGKRVKQGQVIGYVGSTGRSTGTHLHYEVLRKGRQVNPLRVKMPSGYKLKGEELAHFQAARAETDRRFAALEAETTLASGD